MTLRGHVRDGVIVLDDNAQLPEGLQVVVETGVAPHSAVLEHEIPTLYERLAPVIGIADGLPPDLSRNHDHYLHGIPRRS